MIAILQLVDARELITRKCVRLNEIERAVAPILKNVRRHGDRAVRRYARNFDNFRGTSFVVKQQEIESAHRQLDKQFLCAVETASENIREFARTQVPVEKSLEFPGGRRLGQIVRPLDSMGAYIPAGRYPLPSTLLMTVIPAQVAGVKKICVASPKPSLEILGCAHSLGVTRVYRMGGAQAIAALAFGTETVEKVDRIVGPGNLYVAAAKRLVAGEVGIDFVAGPTEIVIIAEDGDPTLFAADMLAQAEHDTDASAILLTTSKRLAEAVANEIERQLSDLPTAAVAREAIDKNSAIIVTPTLEASIEFSNAFAPEHLSIPDSSLLASIQHAGTVFIGPNSPEAAGDYAVGPSHVLPTSGAARLRGGLSAADFVKVIATQELTADALRALTPAITTLARAEGLEAHARSVEARDRR